MNVAYTEAHFTQIDRRAPSDGELIRRIARGDRHAMHLLFSVHKVRVYLYVVRIVRDRTMADDVVSEVFLAVWQQAARFKARSEVSAWLLGIARYKALTAVRSPSTKVQVVSDLEAAAAVIDQADDPGVVVESRTRAAVVRRCMNALGAAHAEVINLAYYQYKSVKEISEIVKVPASTVKTRMFQARMQLHKLLVDAGVDGIAA